MALSRREWMAGLGAAPLLAAAPEAPVLQRHDQELDALLRRQVTDSASRWRGGVPDEFGLHNPGSAGAILEHGAAAYVTAGSRYHQDRELFGRMRLAAEFLQRGQTPEGNLDLLITNFNSPPDTAFVVHGVASAAAIAQRQGARELLALLEPFLRRAGAGMAQGGVHTPNHRWVVCSALAQVHEVFPDPAYPRRIDQWLAEGIDIDEAGQYTERSTSVYNAICDRAFVVMAAKLRRPELLDPVRRNLDAMLYLLHPGYEVVTEISHRQDQYARADMGRYWFPLQYLAVRDGNGRYAALARHFAPRSASLATLLEYPELSQSGPPPAPLPEDYARDLPSLGIARIRRGPVSATLILEGSSRLATFRRGASVIEAVRFAAAFFGKAQFVPQKWEKRGASYVLSQSLMADYVQPLDPPRRVRAGEWGSTRAARHKTEICRLEQTATFTEIPGGLRLRLESRGAAGVPVAVEIALRPGGQLAGGAPAPGISDAWILPEGARATYRLDGDEVRFGPGLNQHAYTQVRGADPKLPGPAVYLCGYTPFDHTIEFS